MTEFLALFGIKPGEVSKKCILTPLLDKPILSELKIKKLFHGKLYSCAATEDFTLIRTGMGAALTGDAVLYLKDTPCREIFLFGSCGLVAPQQGFSIGSLVAPLECYAYESFSEILSGGSGGTKVFAADRCLLDAFLSQAPGITAVSCATVSSLKLEENLAAKFIEKGISVVDMECSAFFSASAYLGLRSMAVFYVTDIIKDKPFYTALSREQKLKISTSKTRALKFLRSFIKKN